ncbi:NifB/NifX family molybdenum-iron cluster-binding protein [Candidatus Solincola sp.]|jgi:predicted Fe-Mo cluster-binding NifX family protein|nr:NifB/NifX family molybdenum-iron cluster-binding protein [Actinomycetota bacterium]MDI7252081.1 NifB/NifX family molybdenum-iron cluster-binding protein [Actinomycetota bacterium]
MLICVAAEGGEVCPHFGHCEEFALFQAEGEEVRLLRRVPNPGHAPGALPPMLKEWGVTHVISGGMGNRAVALFRSLGIEVVTGTRGDLEETARALASGTLTSEENVCDHSGEGDACGRGGEHGGRCRR